MDVKLIVAAGKNAGQKIAVAGPKFFIGRAEDCQLRPNSDLVSRHHCAITVDEGFVAIRDFGSKNGTFVNDERVKAEQELKNGDHVRVGPLEFTVELAVSVGGKKKPKVHSVQEAAARAAQVAATSEDDVDLSALLGEEPEAAVRSQVETQTLDSSLTEVPGAAAAKGADSAQASSEPGKSDDVTRAWKGVQEKKPEANSSREAAAGILKNLFNNTNRGR
jgi:pSer/pThr/pTyr-binding forkhead associated (FHA) protein